MSVILSRGGVGVGLAPQPYLLMYSPVRTFPQDLHLKHPRCHCLSRASSACPFLMSLPQPAQSGKEQPLAVTPRLFCKIQARSPALNPGVRPPAPNK